MVNKNDLHLGLIDDNIAHYTPINTEFLQNAETKGLDVISGYELFFYQGVHAWAHFVNLPPDENHFRSDLISNGDVA